MQAAVMVTGGSGFIGQHVVRKLADAGRTVVAIYHHKLPESLDNVYPVCADIGSPELMAAPLRGVDTVVHLAWDGGLTGPSGRVPSGRCPPDELTPNTRMLRHVITAMERAGTRRIVFLSALGASPHSGVPFLQEKYLAESLILNARIPEKIILRSSVVWGGQSGNDRFLRSIIRVMKFPIYPLPKKTGGLAPLHVHELADVVTSTCSSPLKAQASILEVHGGASYPVNEVFKIVSQTYVKRPRLALGGVLGQSLLPLLERDRAKDARCTKLEHFMAIGGASDGATHVANPLAAMLTERKLSTFKDKITD